MAERGVSPEEDGSICGTTASRRDPADLAARYHRSVGMVLAPKSLYPCLVCIAPDQLDGGVALLTPNRAYVLGAGYFGGSDGPDGCTRQHMLPGLCSAKDLGSGLGVAIYLGGVMVVRACMDNAQGDLPGDYLDLAADCTYSYKGGRTDAADTAWGSMGRADPSKGRKKLARQSDYPLDPEVDEIEREEVDFEIEASVDEFLDVTELDERITEDFRYSLDPKEYVARYLGIDEDDVFDVDVTPDVRSIEGTVTFTGMARTGDGEVYADILAFDAVADAGLVLYLGPDFEQDTIENNLVPIPPDVIGRADWSQTPLRMIVEALEQQASVSGEAEVYLRLCAEALRANGWRQVAEAIEGPPGSPQQQVMFAKNPAPGMAKARRKYARLAREWDEVYGDSSDWS